MNDHGFPLHTEIQRGWRLENRQNASDVEKGARRRTMTAFFTFFEFFETTGGFDPYLAYAKSKAHIRLRRNRRVHAQLQFFQCAGVFTWSNAFAVTDFNFSGQKMGIQAGNSRSRTADCESWNG
jgi:hypothetical protein